MWYRQCAMEKPLPSGGVMSTISWIPEEFAVIGKFLKLDDDDGWRVKMVGARKGDKEVNERSRDYKKQRKGSDMDRNADGVFDRM